MQHNPTPHGFETGRGAAYESDLRDKTRGRIYRVVAKEQKTQKTHLYASLAECSNQELVERLSHPSFRWRLQAQRLLVERKAEDVLQELLALMHDAESDEIGLNVGAIHAAHTLKALGYIQLAPEFQSSSWVRAALEAGLVHPSAGVRRNTIAVLPHDRFGLDLLLAQPQLFQDLEPQVRLQAILSLADMPSSERAGVLIGQQLQGESDSVLIDALTSAAAVHHEAFVKFVSAQEETPSDAMLQVTGQIAEHIVRGRPAPAQIASVLEHVGSNSGLAEALVDGLNRGIPADFVSHSEERLDRALVALFESVQKPVQAKLLRLASRLNSNGLDAHADEIVGGLRGTVSDPAEDGTVRIAAARELLGFQSDDVAAIELVLEQMTPQLQPEVAEGLVQAVSLSSAGQGGIAILMSLQDMTPSTQKRLLDVVLSKPDWSAAMLHAAEAGDFDLNQLSLEQKQRLREFPNRRTRALAEQLLAKDGGLPDADRERVIQSLLHVTQKSGDPEAGKAVFTTACAACHRHGEMGQEIGPNLTGMAVHPKAELLTHIIDPSRNVEGNFRLYNVLTADGQVYSGMLAGETRTAITIVDSQGKQINVTRDDIERLMASRKSVMPEGFEKQLSETQLVDLLEFLTDQGPYVPLPLDQVATAISTKGLFHNGDNGPDRLVFPDWKPKVFEGVPFVLADPKGKSTPNIVLLHGPRGSLPPSMPKSVSLSCGTPARAVHLLSGVGGWSFPAESSKTVSMIVRLVYADGSTEDHNLVNGVHFADYIRKVDVPGSKHAWMLGGQQIRYLKIEPERADAIAEIRLVKGEDATAPIVMAVTVERG